MCLTLSTQKAQTRRLPKRPPPRLRGLSGRAPGSAAAGCVDSGVASDKVQFSLIYLCFKGYVIKVDVATAVRKGCAVRPVQEKYLVGNDLSDVTLLAVRRVPAACRQATFD